MNCGISIGGEGDGYCDFSHSRVVKRSRKPRRCAECRCDIPVGASYVEDVGKFDGDFSRVITCPECKEILDKFLDGSYCVGEMWWEMRNYGFPDFTTGCLDGLSIPAKKKLLAEWRKWKGL